MNKGIFVQLTGRLGNQLFQIALGYSLSQQTNQNFAMVYNSYNRYEQEWVQFFPEILFIPKEIVPLNIIMYSEKRSNINCFKYSQEVLELCKKGNTFFDGYFQSWKYFNEYLPDFKKLFLKNNLTKTDGYFIHVRRGDYVNNPIYEIDYQGYFKQALLHFPEDSHFYIVSDDIQYCEQCSLFKNMNICYVDLDTIGSLQFMASCRGGICANSSFSWWGAFLGQREIVTMPSQWINNNMDTSEVPFPGVIVI